ncbi:MAG: phosphoribosyl-AMP cyclohydrolase [Verrucomicrobiota bacterium]|nr:phosphoribosyl-AMP cyclohydrolase [Verrucomicrobiota bacterium]
MNVNCDFLQKIKFNSDGLVAAIIQDAKTKRVLMMAWMNADSLVATLETGKTNFWSRSRKKYWVKGETSGHTQTIKRFSIDCDGDTLLFEVEQIGGACHAGYESCFFQPIELDGAVQTIKEMRVFDPEATYRRE